MVSKSCGSMELVKNGVNGYVFDPMDMEEIKQLILSIDDVIFEKLLDGVSEFSIYEKDLNRFWAIDFNQAKPEIAKNSGDKFETVLFYLRIWK